MIDLPIDTVLAYDAGTIDPDAAVATAAERLRKPDVSALVVLDDDGGVAGILTETDLVAAVAETPDPVAVERVMSAPVVTAPLSTTVRGAAARMSEAGVGHLPIVDADGAYCGVVSADALAPYCSRHTLDVDATGDGSVSDATEETEVIADG